MDSYNLTFQVKLATYIKEAFKVRRQAIERNEFEQTNNV
jgi:hypothetical protein